MLWLGMFDGPLMLWVNLPVVETNHSKEDKFVKGVKIKATGDLILNDSRGMVRKDMYVQPSGGSRGGARGARLPPLFWVKKEEITEGRKAGRASKTNRPSPLSSRSGSATEVYLH